jgi:hypothetical protein
MYLGLTPNLLHFFPDVCALYALRCAPNFYEIHPKSLQWTHKYKKVTEKSKFEWDLVNGLGVDFVKQFTPCTWNLCSAPILFAKIYSNLASCICTLLSTYLFSPRFGCALHFTPCAQLLWNPPLGLVLPKKITWKILWILHRFSEC